jgi:homoprotocatechuate degradation regulator HpaR
MMPDKKAKELRKYEKSLPISLLRAREATTRYFKPYIDCHDLTMPQWRVLRALAEEEGLDARTLSERCVILPPSLTRIFRSLTQRGLISQVECTDARRHRVMLTEAGRALFEEVVEESEPDYQRLAKAFGAERLDSLLNLLSELRDTVEALNAEDAEQTDRPTRRVANGR